MTRQKFLTSFIRLVTHKASPFSVLFLDEERLKKVLDKLKIVWYNLITRLKESTKKKGIEKMKVIVGYTGYIEKEIEIDDAFAPCADPPF